MSSLFSWLSGTCCDTLKCISHSIIENSNIIVSYQCLLFSMACRDLMGYIVLLHLHLLKFKTCWAFLNCFFSMPLLMFIQYIDFHAHWHFFLFPHGCCVAGLLLVVWVLWIWLIFYMLALFHLLPQGQHGMSNTGVFYCLYLLFSAVIH